MLDLDPNERAAPKVDDANISERDEVTATVNPAAAPATVETFGDLDGTCAPLQPGAPTVNAVAGTATREGPDADLDGRVAALLPNKSIADWSAVSAFMASVVAWPGDKDPGYVNLHYSMLNPKPTADKPLIKGMGWPFRTVTELVSRASWINTTNNFKDVWFCTSLQSQMKQNSKGKPKAVRFASNALLVKSIWIDVDVGASEPGKKPKYPDVPTALKAVLLFVKAVGLPQPSAIIYSGGGIHFYWISKTAMTPGEWQPYASGLKNLLLANNIFSDNALTTDIARLLRVPGTFNHKPEYGQPRPVTLAPMPLKLYDFEPQVGFIRDFATPMSATPGAKPVVELFADGVRHPGFDAPPVLKADPNDTLGAGVTHEEALLDPKPIFKQCGFYKEALLTGGAGYDNALWMFSVLGATFMENGNVIAHAISKGHPSYSEDDTEALYNRKVADRADRNLGYPSCSTIAGAGCKACQTCPLFAKGKSPLNIRPAITATVNDTGSPSGSTGQANWTGRPGISFSNIPHRKWLYGFDLVRGELTVIGSPGGVGKSSLAIGKAICVATNRDLLGEKIRGGANLKALVINGEDDTDVILRRVCGFCLAHGIAEHDLHRLTVVGANDAQVQRISFLTTNERGMSALNQGGLDALQLALDALHPDIVVLDPLVSFCAGGNMNDNSGMSLVMRKLKEIAARNQCAVIIVHHTRKGGDAGNVEAISGAAAITNLARRAIMPAPLTDEDIKRLGILRSERLQYFKLVDAKSNLVPRAADSPLYRLIGVELPNPEPPLYRKGDNVQAITRVVLPTQSGANPDDLKMELAVMEVVARGKEIDGQAYPYSPSLAGATNERALLADAMAAVEKATAPRQWHHADLEEAVKTVITRMQANGRLVVRAMKDLMPHPGRFRKARGLKAIPI
jgi:hypothetical protein